MDEYIDRSLCEISAEFDQHYRLIVPLSKIRKIPAADVAPVVRCRECEHWKDWGACGHPDNGWDAPPMGPEDFCSRGERKADGN